MAENSQYFKKDPDAILPYGVSWSQWLGSDTIAASAWTVPAGLTQVSASFTTLVTTVVLSGGTVGQTYAVKNHITTASGFQDDRTIYIEVVER